MSPNADQFRERKLKELELMHFKISGAVSELQRIDTYAVISVALYYAWFLSDGLKYAITLQFLYVFIGICQ